MEFRFDGSQDFQIDAIDSVVNIFDGQGRVDGEFKYLPDVGFVGIPNRLDIDENRMLKNLQETQQRNGLKVDTELKFIDGDIETVEGTKKARFANFSVEMETGTGKTYVYIRTALELNRRYGYRRFIIVVPSVAIREGVLKSFAITRAHFQNLFDNIPYRFYPYNSANLSQVRQFATSASLEFMIMTLDSFNKSMNEVSEGNIIRRPTDHLQGATPIHLIQTSRPILILDEPQNMESEKSIDALAALDPMVALRYSATHRNPYNIVYRLTPAEAYRRGLVKKIEIASVLTEHDANKPMIRVQSIQAEKHRITATVTINRLMRGGAVKEHTVRVGPGDDLFRKSNLAHYRGIEVEEIVPGSKSVRFTNGLEIEAGDSVGAEKEAVTESQIRYTIEEHLRKQKRLKDRNIKVLSLFFIDKVENYAPKDSPIRMMFERAYNEIKKAYPDSSARSAEEVQAAYFAVTKRRGGAVELSDSTTGKSEKDKEAYELIMKDKERLLSFNENVSFIFSHSALREGWDNPNIFQICTLSQSYSEMRKRQEIGRGVRLCVDQLGERVHDPEVNVLTVVANQAYESFVSDLQNEMKKDYDVADIAPNPSNARKRTTAKLRKEYVLKTEFKTLWNRIKTKTRYDVAVDSETLVREVVGVLDRLSIEPPRVKVTKARVELDDENTYEALQVSAAKTMTSLVGRFPLPNIADVVTHLLENTTPPIRISKRTIIDIFSRTTRKQDAIDNPYEFSSVVARTIREKLADQLVNGISYEKIDDWYEMSQLEDAFDTWENLVVPTERSVYDKVKFQSDVEKQFIAGLEAHPQVKMYIKLPDWFTVPTPVGNYNPDWAIIWNNEGLEGEVANVPVMYLVRETKGTTEREKLLYPNERRKVICGERHFNTALGVDYRVVTSIRHLF